MLPFRKSSKITHYSHTFCFGFVFSENCADDQFQCTNSNECIPLLWYCDDIVDCFDASDENQCSGKEIPFVLFIMVWGEWRRGMHDLLTKLMYTSKSPNQLTEKDEINISSTYFSTVLQCSLCSKIFFDNLLISFDQVACDEAL